MFEIPDIGYDPYKDPNLLAEAQGDQALLDLLAREQVAAQSLYADPFNEDKLVQFTTRRDAAEAYKEHLAAEGTSGQ